MVQFGDAISKNLHQQVFSFTRYLLDHPHDDVRNIHPAYNSVMVSLNSTSTLASISEYVLSAIDSIKNTESIMPRTVEVPVMYGGENGPDLDKVSENIGLSSGEVIKRHSEAEYRVYFIGFSIGFPYLGGMDLSIATPRLDSPRKSVPKGSIGIAGDQTGIYPLSSPGGWNLIGRTEMDIFNVDDPEQSALQMGDCVKFIPVEFH